MEASGVSLINGQPRNLECLIFKGAVDKWNLNFPLTSCFRFLGWTSGRVLNMRQDGIYETPRFYIFYTIVWRKYYSYNDRDFVVLIEEDLKYIKFIIQK